MHKTDSAICAGWGWGMGSYMVSLNRLPNMHTVRNLTPVGLQRGIEIAHNKIIKPMQPNERGQLEDGGCIYTNTPCPNCSVSHNFFAGDPTVYGCIYREYGGLFTLT